MHCIVGCWKRGHSIVIDLSLQYMFYRHRKADTLLRFACVCGIQIEAEEEGSRIMTRINSRV